ncbi:DUF2271 domain-containing protein [Roseomonas sp. 18066]|uniref:DUF2271 domain-containing protein n=1 Tax=Roseomonas sp. 18066 TaxID=2681412 RepID=UPI001358C2F1|nr:DUF2271 domain-containing protein [Roseomonas sp. 18066]
MRAASPVLAAGLVLAGTAQAAELRVSVELPRLTVAEYHRPYLAAWIETPDQAPLSTVAVWYDTKLREERGQGWLRDLRTWWRRSGREMRLPAEGISGPTRAPGRHEITAGNAALRDLAPGEYRLAVEVARESGGRELVRVPFQWPPRDQASSASGSSELGVVAVSARR